MGPKQVVLLLSLSHTLPDKIERLRTHAIRSQHSIWRHKRSVRTWHTLRGCSSRCVDKLTWRGQERREPRTEDQQTPKSEQSRRGTLYTEKPQQLQMETTTLTKPKEVLKKVGQWTKKCLLCSSVVERLPRHLWRPGLVPKHRKSPNKKMQLGHELVLGPKRVKLEKNVF